MVQICCPYCGARYSDADGRLEKARAGLAEAPVLVVAGCGGCGRLFLPHEVAAPAPAPTVQPAAPAPRYQLRKLLGQGGMGETYSARDERTGALVCVKQLRDPQLLATLRQEWRALERLQHGSIVRLLDLVEEEGHARLVMELVCGESLRALVQRCAPLAEPLAASLARQLAEALAYATARNVIHCDLKPENIMVALDGARLVPKVLDFGLAVVERVDASGVSTAVGRVAGTVPYMAPEQFEGRELSPACDVYAFGLILAELFFGQPCFPPGDLWTTYGAKRQLEEGIVLPTGLVPPALGRVVQQCTRADPARRLSWPEVTAAVQQVETTVAPPAVIAPVNLGFDALPDGGWPPGWFDSHDFVAGVSTDYQLEVRAGDNTEDGSRHLELQAPRGRGERFGSVMQRCPARHLAGRRIRLEGALRAAQLEGWAGLWVRGDDGAGRTLVLDNMRDHPLRGSSAWERHVVEIDLPGSTEWLNYGLLLVGGGGLAADDLRLAVCSPDGRWVDLAVDPLPAGSTPRAADPNPTSGHFDMRT
jgi:hypothetical protein